MIQIFGNIDNEIIQLKQQREILSKLLHDQKLKSDQFHNELNKLPQIQETQNLIMKAKAPIKDLEAKLRELQKAKQEQSDVMLNLIDQVTFLKSKKIMWTNGIDPSSKEKQLYAELKNQEVIKIEKLKQISDNISNVHKGKKANFAMKKKELEARIAESKQMLQNSEANRQRSHERLYELSPKFSQASLVLKKKVEKAKRDYKLQQDGISFAKKEKQESVRLSRSMIRKSAITLNKDESEELLAMQYKNKMRAVDARKRSQMSNVSLYQNPTKAKIREKLESSEVSQPDNVLK